MANPLATLLAVSALALAAGAAFAQAKPQAQPVSLTSADLGGQASDFVRANARVNQFGYTVRWERPLCVDVTGLTPEQDAAVKARIDAVAQTLSQRVYSELHQMCAQKNVWITFTSDPQGELDRMAAKDPRILGDAHSDTKGVRTVTQPIQAWRQTVCLWRACDPDPVAEPPLFARVLVDRRRVDTGQLSAIADYVAMLVLADPKTLDHCQVLPSITDLFAGPCAGRPEPTGLTRSDLAYLRSLYTAGSSLAQNDWGWSEHGGPVDQIAGRMSMLLAGHGTVLTPGAKPERR
jgi:hypothetical protein